MPMSVEQAFELQGYRRKLALLRDKTADQGEKNRAIAELARIEPYLDQAGAIVIRATDEEFQAVADTIKTKMKPLDDALADIKKLSAAITQVAAAIDAIIQVLGAVAHL